MTVMERDLKEIRNAREERERALDASKQATAHQNGRQAGPLDTASVQQAKADPDSNVRMEDSMMANFNDLGASQFDIKANSIAKSEQPDPEATPTGTSTTNIISNPSLATTNAQPPSSSTAPANENATSSLAQFGSPTDFDSLFADATGNNEDDGLNFDDLDFGDDGTDNNIDNNLASDANNNGNGGNSGNSDLFGDLIDTSDRSGGLDFSNLDGGADKDINSLLPGLESYVDVDDDGAGDGGGAVGVGGNGSGGAAGGMAGSNTGGDDFAMIDMPPAGEAFEVGNGSSLAGPGKTGSANANAVSAGSVPSGESGNGAITHNAVDLLSGGVDTTMTGLDGVNGDINNSGGGDMDDIFGDTLDLGNMDGDGIGNFDEFDDWFKTDG